MPARWDRASFGWQAEAPAPPCRVRKSNREPSTCRRESGASHRQCRRPRSRTLGLAGRGPAAGSYPRDGVSRPAVGLHRPAVCRGGAASPWKRAATAAAHAPDPPYRWRYLGRDLAGVLRNLDVRGACGVGHSSGGHSMVQTAALDPESFAAMLLIDPTIFPVARYGGAAARFRLYAAPQERLALAGGNGRALPRPPAVRQLAAGDSARLLPVRAVAQRQSFGAGLSAGRRSLHLRGIHRPGIEHLRRGRPGHCAGHHPARRNCPQNRRSSIWPPHPPPPIWPPVLRTAAMWCWKALPISYRWSFPTG